MSAESFQRYIRLDIARNNNVHKLPNSLRTNLKLNHRSLRFETETKTVRDHGINQIQNCNCGGTVARGLQQWLDRH